MKLILRDYLSTLREEGELDVLIFDLLFAKGISPISKPQKGVRQHGVDIAAKGIDDGVEKLFLVAVKRGDITRKTWDDGPQSVRQSLNEILDVYLGQLTPAQSKLTCKIIVATNGVMNQEVLGNWNGYVGKNEKTGRIELEFWDIHQLTSELETYYMHEGLMIQGSKDLLRKTLSLLELNDYDLRHYYQLIEEVLFEKEVKNIRDAIKRLRLLNLCQNIILKWGEDTGNLRNVYLSSERLVLRIGVFYAKYKYFEKKDFDKELFRIVKTRSHISYSYFAKVKPQCFVSHALATYTNGIEIEYSLLVYEQMGIIALIGLENIYLARQNSLGGDLQTAYENFALECTEALWALIENNPASKLVLYDDYIVEISLVLLLFYSTSSFEAGQVFIHNLLKKMVQTFCYRKFFPCFIRNYDKLLDVSLGIKESDVNSSHLWLALAEWSLVFGSFFNYDLIVESIQKFFPDLNLQVWYPDENTEATYYEKNAVHDSGIVQTSIVLPIDYRDHIKVVQKEFARFNSEKEFFLKNSLGFLPLISARHFRNLPFPSLWRCFLQKDTPYN